MNENEVQSTHIYSIAVPAAFSFSRIFANFRMSCGIFNL